MAYLLPFTYTCYLLPVPTTYQKGAMGLQGKGNSKQVSIQSFGLRKNAEARKSACLIYLPPRFRRELKLIPGGPGFQKDSGPSSPSCRVLSRQVRVLTRGVMERYSALLQLQRFQRLVSHVGGSGFLIVKPANRWGFVCSSRVRPSQRVNSGLSRSGRDFSVTV